MWFEVEDIEFNTHGLVGFVCGYRYTQFGVCITRVKDSYIRVFG